MIMFIGKHPKCKGANLDFILESDVRALLDEKNTAALNRKVLLLSRIQELRETVDAIEAVVKSL